LEAKAARKAADDRYEVIKNELVAALNGASTAETAKFLVLYFNRQSTRIDSKKLEQDLPDLYKEYLRTIDSWNLIVNKK